MRRIAQLGAAWRRITAGFAALMLLGLAIGGSVSFAQMGGGRDFDHLKTGFALTGTHVQTRCESCHQNGIFKGTPRDCASCHVSGMRFARGNVVMPQNHLPTTQACETCHNTKSYTGARFNHLGVAPGSCASCHNGTTASAKSSNHIATTASCDSCHRTNAWSPAAKFDHGGVVAGTCTSCHGAGKATGKPASHMPTSANQSCDVCHRSFTAWRPTAWNHTQVAVAGQCASCHSGGFPPADGRPANHVPYAAVAAAASANCDTCHKGSFATWVNGRFHANVAVTTGCVSCHTGSFMAAVGKPNNATHASVTGNCESCHKSTGTWAGAQTDHSTFTTATNCSTCHGAGGSASQKPASHFPTTLNCFTCHNVSPARWTPTKWNHTQLAVANACASCHTGAYPPADGRPASHIPYQTVAAAASANCDACHKGSTSTWANGRFHANVTVTTGCVSCHTGAFMAAVGKPNNATHATVTGNCESCHKSTSTWSGARTDHSTFTAATNCSSCHGAGGGAAQKPATHFPTTLNCFSCHNVSPALWTPTKWNHTQMVVANACASCHTGGYPPADGRPANHIPYQTVAVSASANCDGCHRGSTSTWANGRFHANYSVASGCVSCHTGSFMAAVGKPNNTTHATVTGNCESCHKSTSTWGGARVDHSSYTAATNCASCHNGSGGTGKPGNHIPTTANCFSCHNVSPALWTPTKWNHTQVVVANACASCHSGGYPPADGRPANHIPYQTVPATSAANCDGCHRGSTSTWANGRLHSYYTVTTGCVSCHTLTAGGTYLNAVGKPNTATHSGVTGNCESCHRSTTSWAAATFAHSAANAVGTGTCDTCHNGSAARGKPATHIPVSTGPTKCDSCHRSQASWTTAVTMNHAVVTATQCKLCHNGSYVSQGTQGALAKPTNHIPEVQLLAGATMDCNACHKSTAGWGTSLTMNHNGSQGNGAGWCKGCHTSGQAFLGSMEKKSLTHERSTGVTDCSQSGCHRPLGTRGTPYTKW